MPAAIKSSFRWGRQMLDEVVNKHIIPDEMRAIREKMLEVLLKAV